MSEVVYCDHDHGADMLIKTSQDCAGVIEHNKILADLPPGKDFRLMASVPIIFADQAIREGWFNDDDRWNKFLNDPDYRAFRVAPGRM